MDLEVSNILVIDGLKVIPERYDLNVCHGLQMYLRKILSLES